MYEEQRELTYGEKAVGLTFNPSNNPQVQTIKELYAKIIDICDGLTKLEGLNKDYSEAHRLAKVAITEAQTAQMWAVKAITYQF